MKPAVPALAVLAVAPLLSTACLRPGESRAECDIKVGHASAAGLRVDVDGGLAAVRGLSAGTLRLWGGAPTLEVTVSRDAGASADWELLLDNCMPHAELSASPSISAAPVDRAAPTECGWSLTLPADEPVRLSIAPPAASTQEPYRFGVLSDVQNAVDEVGDIFDLMNQDPDLSFIISAGDLSESAAGEQFARFRSELRALNIPHFSTLGNHDVSVSSCRYHHYFGRGSFHFTYRGVHFTMLDSASGTPEVRLTAR